MSVRPRRAFIKHGAGGWVIIQALASFIGMSIVGSMAVDIGVFYTARTELERAADAAALASGALLRETGDISAAMAEAVTYAQANAVGGVKIQSSAVSFTAGSWQNGQFSSGVTPYTAVQVKLTRSHSFSNAVPLYFSQLIGLPSIDVIATSTVRIRPTVPAYNLVGINSASFASAGVLAKITGRLVSNGRVSVGMPAGLAVSISGDSRSYAGANDKGALASISGSRAALSQQLVYPSAILPSGNNNDRIATLLDSQGNFTAVAAANIPAGVYVVKDLNIVGGLAVNLQGPVTFYVQGNFNIAVGINLLGSSAFSAENFKVRVLGGGSVNFLATLLAPVNLDLYAPDSDISISLGLSQYTGRIIGKTLTIGLPLPGSITEDTTLSDVFAGTPTVAVVR